MVELTVQQGHIGQVLHAGNQLLVDGQTTEDDARQIEAQMAVLNTQWEELRVQAMARQTRQEEHFLFLFCSFKFSNNHAYLK